MDEIEVMIGAIAMDEGNRDQFKALKHLSVAKQSSVVLDPILDPAQMLERLSRLMKGAGIDLCQRSFARAFPQAKSTVADAPPMIPIELPFWTIEKIHKIKKLKQLYHVLPELKRHGFPPGYPVGKSPLIQAEWLQNLATKVFMDRQRTNQLVKESMPEFVNPQELKPESDAPAE